MDLQDVAGRASRSTALNWQREHFGFTLKRPPSVAILRVNQMDAARLDLEMIAMLKDQLVKVFSLVEPGLLARYEPELNAFLDMLIWRFSIWVDRPTPGNALMNLRYRDECSYSTLAAAGEVRTVLDGPGLTNLQKLCYCLAMVGGQYGWSRLQMLSAFQRWGDIGPTSLPRRIWGLLQRSEGAYKELLLLVLPLLNMISLKKVLAPFTGMESTILSLREDACPICCAFPIVVPYMAVSCEHLYCYFCLRTRCISNPAFHCVRCAALVGAMRRQPSGKVPV